MTKAAAVVACLLAVTLAGCGARRSPEDRALEARYRAGRHPANPVAGLRKAGLVVLDVSLQYHPDAAELTSALFGELQQVRGLEVIPPRLVLPVLEAQDFVMPRDGLKLADALSADGVFVAIVTDYNPYGEPSMAVALTLFSRATSPVRAVDLDRVIQGGRPLSLPTDARSKPVTAVHSVYDASHQGVQRRIRWFAEGRMGGADGLGWQRYYRSMPNFMRFVSYELVWEMFEQLAADQAAAGGQR